MNPVAIMASNKNLKDFYKSDRLVYRSLEDNKEDKEFLYKLFSDPINQSFADYKLRRPTTEKEVDGFLEMVKKSLLIVKICLSPDERKKTQQHDATAAGREQEKNEEERGTTKEEPLTPIGFVSLFNMNEATLLTRHHRNATLGISLLEDYRGKAYGGEAINWILDWAFISAGLHRVNLECFSFNVNAQKLYRKVGFVEEGRLREVMYYERSWHDIISFSMLEQEWEKLRGLICMGADPRVGSPRLVQGVRRSFN